MKRLITNLLLISTVLVVTNKECFAMHPYSKMAVDLKKAGYPQTLTIGNNLYLVKSNNYMTFAGQEPDEEYVVVPKLENLVSNVADLNYETRHEVGVGGKEIWTIRFERIMFADDTLWMVLGQLWLYQKGKK